MRHHDTLLELSNYYQPLITITTLYLFIILNNNNNNNNNNQHTHTDSSNTTHMCLLQFTCFITANTRSHYPFLFMDDHFCVMVWLLWIFHMITTTRSTHTHTHTRALLDESIHSFSLPLLPPIPLILTLSSRHHILPENHQRLSLHPLSSTTTRLINSNSKFSKKELTHQTREPFLRVP